VLLRIAYREEKEGRGELFSIGERKRKGGAIGGLRRRKKSRDDSSVRGEKKGKGGRKSLIGRIFEKKS